MRGYRLYKTASCLVLVGGMLFCGKAYAQKERADIRKGNRAYYEGKFPEAEVGYRRAIDKNVGSFEANYNLAGALYKQGRYDDAAAGYNRLTQDGSDRLRQAYTFYNMGNALLEQRKLDEAIEAYKNSLRINPTDKEAKFNLAYAKKLKEEDEKDDDNDDNDNQDNSGGGGGGGGGGQDNPDNQGNDPDNNDGDNNDNQNNPGDQDSQNDNRDRDNQSGQQPQSPTREESERLLRAIQASEDNTKKKVDEQNAEAVVGRGGKQW